MAWGKAGTTTLSSTGDDIDITSMTASKFNTALMHIFVHSGTTGHRKRFGSGSIDTGSNYAERASFNGASDVTYASQNRNTGDNEIAGDRFQVEYGMNIATQEKLFIYFDVIATASGAGTSPNREEYTSKWVNTSDQYDQRRSYNALSGSYNTDSNVTAIGSDLTPVVGASFPTDVQVGSRAEITDTRKMYDFQVASTATLDDDFTSSGSTSHTSDNTTVGGWLAQDISYTKVNGSTDVMDINIQEDGTNDSISYDLGAGVSETKWVLRFKMNHSSRETNGVFFFGLSDKDSVSGETTAQDVIGIRWDGYYGGTTGRYGAFDLDGVALNLWNIMGENSINSTFSLSTDYFVEIKRTSATSFTVEIFTSSDYSTGSFGVCNGVTTSGVTGLRYIKLVNMMSSLTTHSLQGTIDDVKFYNGITSVLESSTWQEIGT